MYKNTEKCPLITGNMKTGENLCIDIFSITSVVNIIKLQISVLRTFSLYFRKTENRSLDLRKIRHRNTLGHTVVHMVVPN